MNFIGFVTTFSSVYFLTFINGRPDPNGPLPLISEPELTQHNQVFAIGPNLDSAISVIGLVII